MKINKQLKTLTLFIATSFTMNAWSQGFKDITSEALTNPSFELSAEGVNYESTVVQKLTSLYGWEIPTPQEQSIANATSTEIGFANNGAGGVNPSDGNFFFWCRKGWGNASGALTTTTATLEAGTYYVEFDYKLADYANNNNYKNLGSTMNVAVKLGETELVATTLAKRGYAITNSSSNPGNNTYMIDAPWTKMGAMFTLPSDGAATITVNQNLVNSGRSDVCYDNFKLYRVYDEEENGATAFPLDVTGYIANPSFEAGGESDNYSYHGWTVAKTGGEIDVRTTGTEVFGENLDGIRIFNAWDNSSTNDKSISQVVAGLPLGKYKLTAYIGGYKGNSMSLFAGENSVVVAMEEGTSGESNAQFAELSFTKKNAEDLTIGIQSTVFYKADNFRLYYLGVDLSELQNTLSTYISEAESLSGNIPTAAYNNLNAIISANKEPAETKSALETAINNVNTAINNAKALVNPYANFKTLLTTCNAILTNSEEFEDGAKTTFTEAINAAQTNVESVTTADDINAEYTTLETARQTYVQKADPTNDTYFDYTFKVTNAAVVNGDGWTGARTNAGEQYTGAPDNTYWDSWNGAGQNIYQEVANLPSGLYTLKAAGRASTACTSAYIYLNDTKVEIEKAGNSGNDLGGGWKWYTTEKTAVASIATIGFGCNTASSQWAGADDFHLYYHGFDAATAQNSVTTLKTEAEELVGKVMNKNVATNLDNAISGADATKTTRNELNAMISALNDAITAAEASIADYEIISTYITKANKIDESIAAEYQTAYNERTLSESAETVFQKLEVATYNYVTETFNYNVAISSTWNSTGTNTSAAELSNEHWSGETRPYMNQNDNNGQGWNAKSWSLDFDQEVELPAGEYVFKVAGRKSLDATLRLVVTQGEEILGTVEDFPNGNTGRGINKAGAASFDANDPAGFTRNDGTGFGWQWRYVKFTLSEKSTVKIAVHAETSAINNWVSFGDYTVQMSEETYLEANKGALEAPTAAAKALEDTKPMGDDENAALKEALALPVNTGAELQAKIDALNTAVANANTWVAAYNEAKAPLVAALERFETDYNLEGDVDHAHMSNSVWANVLAMVEAASAAKDVTNSYEGFATATTNLVAALDAADGSIAEYAALKEAIDNANAAATVNWGDEPFQRPTEFKEDLTTAINAAQAVYDAATEDGEGVTSQTTALNDALDVVNNLELNAPAKGAVYNIVVATAGHTLEGAPVVATLDASKANGSDANNLTGYGFAAKDGYTDGPANMLYTFTKVEGNKYNISVKVKGETVYLTYGSLNGSAAGWKESQIQGTTDIEKAGKFDIVASNTTEGIIKIRNTVTGDFLDCEDGASIYTNGDMEKEDFMLTLVEELSAEISIDAADKYATCVLMFNADLANTKGLTVYVPESYTTQDGLNYFFFKAFEEAVLPAYTPCILYAANGFEGTLTGTVNMDGYAYNVAKGRYLYGALESQEITEGYVMVKLDGEDEVTFRNVEKYGLAESIEIPAGKCWLQVPAVQASVASFTCLFRGGDASNIDEVLLDKISVKDGAIYTLDGKRVSNIERGKIYVINGQKVIVK